MTLPELSDSDEVPTSWFNEVRDEHRGGLVHDATYYGATGDGVIDDTSSIQAAADALGSGDTLFFRPGDTYRITATINVALAGKRVWAYGATFLVDEDVLAFNVNPNANPANVEGGAMNHGQWHGGHFTSSLSGPSNATAIRAYAARNFIVRDLRIGAAGQVYFKNGIEFSGLGGYKFINVRGDGVERLFYAPAWATEGGAGDPITTTTLSRCEAGLGDGKQFLVCEASWNRWNIENCFAGGTAATDVIHFQNKQPAGTEPGQLRLSGCHFEQPSTSTRFLFIEDTDANPVIGVSIDSCKFQGSPGAGMKAIQLERVQDVEIHGATWFEQVSPSLALDLDANCKNVDVSRTVRFSGGSSAVTLSMARAEVSHHPVLRSVTYSMLSGYNGNSFSTFAEATLDMSSVFAGFPSPVVPRGYFVTVQARDSGSAGSSSARVELGQQTGTPVQNRVTVDLAGVVNDQKVSQSAYIPADSNGDIMIRGVASGAGTLDIWVAVTGVAM